MGFQMFQPGRFEVVGGGAPVVRGVASNFFTTDTMTVAQADFDVVPQSGDILVMFMLFTGDPKTATLPGTPSGWTASSAIFTDNPNARKFGIYYKTAGGSEGTYTFTGQAALIEAWAVVVACSSATAFDVASVDSNVASANMVAPSVDTTGSTDLLLGFWADANAANTTTLPGSMTLVVEETTPPVFNYKAGKETLSASGATGTRTATRTGSGLWVASLAAVK